VSGKFWLVWSGKLLVGLRKKPRQQGLFLRLLGVCKNQKEVVTMEDSGRESERAAGRPRKMTQEQLAMAARLYFGEGMPVREVADAMRISHMTVWRAISRVSVGEAVEELRAYNR
jgi:predicted DNA-binding protein (UPF0251 family)